MNRAARRAYAAAQRAELPKTWAWEERQVGPEWRDRFPACARIKTFYVNRAYSVQRYELETTWGRVDHLVVRPHDLKPIRDWQDLQSIKTDLAGPDRIAIEVFPREGELVDQVNNYHLWVLPAGMDLPFGLHLPGGGM